MTTNFKKPKMVRIQNSLSFDMIKIKAGSFKMGSDEYYYRKPIHKVTIDYDFELGKYPVTIAEYMHFAKNNEEHLPEWKEKDRPSYYENMDYSDNAPIIGVSWHNAVVFCDWLNEKQKEYVYRLPSEAEWEYACRAESRTTWHFGDEAKELDKYAWYRNNSDRKTHTVGEKEPNKWGLYDMHGNVYEWCLDDYVESYEKTPIDGSANKKSEVKNKVLRGGRLDNVGFRLLRTLP